MEHINDVHLLSAPLPDIPGGKMTQTEAAISSTMNIEYKKDPDECSSKNKTDQNSASTELPNESSDTLKRDNETDDEQDDDSEDDFELDYDSDDPMEFGNFGLNDSPSSTNEHTEETRKTQREEVPSQSTATAVNKEQAKMELFWRLMDMGFSRGKLVV